MRRFNCFCIGDRSYPRANGIKAEILRCGGEILSPSVQLAVALLAPQRNP